MLTTEIRLRLDEVGLDVSEMVDKFMNSEEMFLKYFRKFFSSADSVVQELEAAVNAADNAAVENRAHALKGLSGNIGLNGVYEPAKKIVDDVRAERFDSYRSDYDKLRAAYDKARAIADELN